MKTVNIVTRTSGRPNFFKLCRENIVAQDYPHIRHIVLVDNNNDNSYVNDYPDIDKVIHIPDGKYPHFDSYLNEALEFFKNEVNDELFCMMDDDDFYTCSDAISLAAKQIENKDVIFYKVQAAGGCVPFDHFMGGSRPLEYGQVSMLGFMMRTEFPNTENGQLLFDPKYGGDFYFIDKVVRTKLPDAYASNTIAWLPRVLASTNPVARQGQGACNDVDYNLAKQAYLKVFNNAF